MLKSLRVVAVFILLLATQSVLASRTEVVSTGYGDSRQKALDDAHRAAIEQGLGVILESQTIVKNYVVEEDQIKTISSGVVSNSKVLSEQQDKSGTWSVKVSAIVDSNKLEGNLELLLKQLDSPRSIVISDPRNHSNSQFLSSARRQLNAALLQQGFDVIDQDVSREIKSQTAQLMNVNSATNFAAKLALKYNADVAWYMQVKERRGSAGYGFSDVTVDVACKVISASNAEVFADAEISVKGIDSADAVKKASKRLATELLGQVKVKFATLAQAGNRYSIRLWNIKNYREARKFRKAISKLDAAKGVKQNTIAIEAGKGKNFVDITLTYRGSAEDLLDGIFDHVTDPEFENLNLRLQRATQIELEL